METCVRGFSFMPETKVETGELKYVESEDLERTWKVTRRERLKKQEQKIWEEFIMEQDIVRNASQEDPYQFLDQISEECIKELLDLELQKMQQEILEEQNQETKEEQINDSTDNQHIVTFVENEDQEYTMFQVFDDEKDDEISGPEEEALNDSINSPPCTVRERQEERQDNTPRQSRPPSPEKICSKPSTENVTSLIENSIYCAKVKELRMKINEELMNIVNILENQNIASIDPCDIPKMMKHSTEFCSRYNRVHLYQLQRQMADIDRNAGAPLPFAQRTHQQAQLARVASLHGNMLHAGQVLLKSFQQTSCIGEASELVRGLVRVLREAKDCVGLVESLNVFDDTIEETCGKLEETLNEYTTKMSDFLNNIDSTSASSKKSNNTKSRSGIWPKSGNKSLKNDETRLSMYSLEAMRVTLNPKSSKCKDTSSSSSKLSNMKSKDSEKMESGTSKKTPRRRRPLMRGATCARERAPCEQDVHTLVEVIACTSSHNDINKALPKTKLTPRTPRSNRKPNKTNNKINTSKSLNNKSTVEDSRAKDLSTKIDSSRSNKEKETDANRSVLEKETEDGNACASERDRHRVESDVKVQEKCGDNKKEDRTKAPDAAPDSCEVTKVLRQLCGGDNRNRNEHVSGSRNAQLLCVQESSPRKPSTPQLLRILEETIQKKAPKPLFPKPMKVQDAEKCRMTLTIPENVKDDLLKYRTKFVQHMLTSSMYANSAVGKPWEKIGSVSEKIIDELLLNCAKEMELHHFVTHLYKSETS